MLPKSILIGLTVFLAAVAPVAGQTAKVGKKDLKKVVTLMAGEFSSEEQAAADKSFFHIKLRMKPIWLDRKDGAWLYVEQAAADTEDKPYRQRIYNVYLQGKEAIVSKVYEMPDPAKYVGAWNDVDKLKTLERASLIDRQGCSIILTKAADGTYAGSTPGKECLSSLRGAMYATSEVHLFDDRLVSWDRGWDKDGKQVWGAVKGGYIFKKLRDLK